MVMHKSGAWKHVLNSGERKNTQLGRQYNQNLQQMYTDKDEKFIKQACSVQENMEW